MKEIEETSKPYFGKNSIIKKFSVDIEKNHTSQLVLVQLDRMGRIIEMKPRVGDALTHFQGQQYLVDDVKKRLQTYCEWFLNRDEDEEVTSVAALIGNGLTAF